MKALDGAAGAIIILIPVPLAIGAINMYLEQLFLPASFLFSTTVLIYSFGPKTFYERAKDFCHSHSCDDKKGSTWLAEQLLGRKLTSNELKTLSATVAKSLFIIANERILAPVFWFVVLGPMGAILYRCAEQFNMTCKSEQCFINIHRSILFIFGALNWFPARISAFGYAAMGNFTHALENYRKDTKAIFKISNEYSEFLLVDVGSRALNLAEQPEGVTNKCVSSTISLIRRNYAMWLGIISLMILSGWLN